MDIVCNVKQFLNQFSVHESWKFMRAILELIVLLSQIVPEWLFRSLIWLIPVQFTGH